MMPMFLHRSNGTCLGTVTLYSFWGSKLYVVILSGAPFASRRIWARRARRPRSLRTHKSRAWRASLLPSVMRERLIGFRHAVYVFFLLDRRAAVIRGVEQFVAQLVDHSLLAASAGVGQNPANRQRGAPVRIHLHRYLVVGSAHAPGLHFQHRLDVLHRFLEQLQRL